jgi:solute carrier family 13 (sodium-dependent dicarboxylate transporter), member 2/3/5
MPDLKTTIRTGALFMGPVLAGTVWMLPPPEGLGIAALAVSAVAVWMVVWWMTEAVPLAVTALLPVVLFPALGVASTGDVTAAYANPLIFLFLGGFLLAKAIQRWGLSRRIALWILGLAGKRPSGVVAAIMTATAFLSMWVSNTATAMMMLPIGQSIIYAVNSERDVGDQREAAAFCTALMLGIAYGATIGGMGTLIGTPPNALFAGFMAETYGIEISFSRWMMIGVPAVAVLLPTAWLVLTRVSFTLPSQLAGLSADALGKSLEQSARMSVDERRVGLLVLIAAFAWLTRPLLEGMLPWLSISDAAIAIAVAILLFIIPSRSKPDRSLLTWDDAQNIRWDVLVLFGGGLALADAIASTGLAAWLGSGASLFTALPWLILILLIVTVIVFVGELASNTAMAAVFLPIVGASAVQFGASPVIFSMAVALAASLGFMLPVATPPNAIVYGSGAIRMEDMMRAGMLLNVLGILVVALLVMSVGQWLFGS